MDTFTHALMGVAVGEAFFRKRLGRGTLLTAASASILPDLDMIAGFWGNGFQSLAWHRAESHSLILTALVAPAFGWLAAQIFTQGEKVCLWSLLVLTALWLHITLDLCTSWGTEALAPFSKTRYAWDLLPIIDPFISLPLLLAAFLTLIPPLRRTARIAATTALLCCAAYTGAGGWMNWQAKQIARKAFSAPAATKLRAIPAFGTIFLWNVIAHRAPDSFQTISVSTWIGQPVLPLMNYPPCDLSLCQRAAQLPTGQLLLRTSGGYMYFAPSDSSANPYLVMIYDIRYPVYTPQERLNPASNFRYLVNFSNNQTEPVFVRQHSPFLHRNRLLELRSIWSLAYTGQYHKELNRTDPDK